MADSADKGFIIENPGDPETRMRLALIVLKARLELAIRFGRTDPYALHAARDWAIKFDIKSGTKTMKQNLRWITRTLADIKAADEQDPDVQA